MTTAPELLHSRQVEAMAGFGVPVEDIALVLSVDRADLERDYPHELRSGSAKANARVAESLFRRATGDGREAVTAAIFWLKTRAGWRETNVHEFTGAAPITRIELVPLTARDSADSTEEERTPAARTSKQA